MGKCELGSILINMADMGSYYASSSKHLGSSPNQSDMGGLVPKSTNIDTIIAQIIIIIFIMEGL